MRRKNFFTFYPQPSRYTFLAHGLLNRIQPRIEFGTIAPAALALGDAAAEQGGEEEKCDEFHDRRCSKHSRPVHFFGNACVGRVNFRQFPSKVSMFTRINCAFPFTMPESHSWINCPR